MAGKRDAAYYRARLRRDHPKFFGDLIRGKYASVSEAAAAAGLIHLPTRFDALKREWKGASSAQQAKFVIWLKSGAYKWVGRPITDSEGVLRRDVSDFLLRWAAQRGIRPTTIMKEFGFSGHDPTFLAAVCKDGPLRAEVIPKLTAWLKKQGIR